MANKPILFSGPMVRAILEGRKNRTRRLIKPPVPLVGQNGGEFLEVVPTKLACGFGFDWRYRLDNPEFRKPRYRKGDLLWVREAWFPDPPIDGWAGDITWNGCGRPIDGVPQKYRLPEHVIYRATWEGAELIWRPSIHMPKWACRLWLRVPEEPTPERVRDITEAEAIREGIQCVTMADIPRQAVLSERADLKQVWDKLHGPDSWERDWVWRIPLERTEAPHG